MDMSWASRRVGRKGERRVELRGGRMVDAGMVEVRGTEPLIAGSLRRVVIVVVSWLTEVEVVCLWFRVKIGARPVLCDLTMKM